MKRTTNYRQNWPNWKINHRRILLNNHNSPTTDVDRNKSFNSIFFPRLLLLAVLLFIFILPLKLGTPAGFSDINIMPETIVMWIFLFWPPLLFSLISAFLLILCIFATPITTFNYRNYAIETPLLFTVLAFCSLTGFMKATCLDFPIQECLYIFGLSAFSMVMFTIIMQKWFSPFLILKVIAISTLIIICYGISQYISGFENTREYVTEVLTNKNILLSEEAKSRLNNNFIFSTFAISNNFAAHLILTAPVCLYTMLYSDLFKTKMIRRVLAFAFILLVVIALLLSGSRGAILSFAAAFIILFVLLNMKRKASLFLIFGALLAAITIIFLVPKDSGSIFIRFDYLHTGIILFKNNIFTGAGWGDFFHSYTYLKKFLTTEAPHDPHNFIISMGSQAGIFAMITAALIILIPILLVFNKLNKFPSKEKFKTMEFSMLLGFAAWSIHSFMDINFQIPGTTATAIILCIIMTKNDSPFYCRKEILIVLKSIFLLIALGIIFSGCYRLRGEYYLSKLSNICWPQFSSSNSTNINITDAEKLLKATIKSAPYSPFAWAAFGSFAIKNKMEELAELCFTNAISLSPRRASFYYNLAMIQLETGKMGYAIRNMEIAAELFPYKYGTLYDKMRENYRGL